MYSDDEIDSAVLAGAISAEAAAALRAHVAAQRHAPNVDEEHFRLVSGFNDVFVVVACCLLVLAVAWIGESVRAWLGAFMAAGASWGLAEFFVRSRRMALPAVFLLLAFVAGVYFGLADLTSSHALAGAAAAFAALAHWARFHVPITVAAGLCALVIGTISALVATVPGAKDWVSGLMFCAGIAVLAYAMRWDASDRLRQTRRADVAFWLHLLAAPLLVHPVFSALGIFTRQIDLGGALLVLALYIAIGFVSLCIDRRALMISALGYVLYAFSALLKSSGVVSLSFSFTALFVGAALLVLSARWQKSRAVALRALPAAVLARVPPLR
jgi:hypothetical protein